MKEYLAAKIVEIFGRCQDPNEIAELCRQKQIQGFIGNATSCPMVKLMYEYVDFQIAYTLGKKLGTGYWWVTTRDSRTGIPAPLVCDQFSANFDAGKYPDLIAWNTQEVNVQGVPDVCS